MSKWIQDWLDDDIADEDTPRDKITNVDRCNELRGRVIELANFYERVDIVILIGLKEFSRSITSFPMSNISLFSTFIAENILRDLEDEEGYDWTDLRTIGKVGARTLPKAAASKSHLGKREI